jgi:hypothetical protein
MAAFSAVLKSEWEAAANHDELRTELLDAIAFMAAIEGGTLPPDTGAPSKSGVKHHLHRRATSRGHRCADGVDGPMNSEAWIAYVGTGARSRVAATRHHDHGQSAS